MKVRDHRNSRDRSGGCADAFAQGGPVPCALTGELLHSMIEAHVDHYDPTFLRLATDFVVTLGGWESVPLYRADGLIGLRMADPAQHQRWVDHHQDAAQLRVVSINANLSLLAKGSRS